jgi:hypothetical protein
VANVRDIGAVRASFGGSQGESVGVVRSYPIAFDTGEKEMQRGSP